MKFRLWKWDVVGRLWDSMGGWLDEISVGGGIWLRAVMVGGVGVRGDAEVELDVDTSIL